MTHTYKILSGIYPYKLTDKIQTLGLDINETVFVCRIRTNDGSMLLYINMNSGRCIRLVDNKERINENTIDNLTNYISISKFNSLGITSIFGKQIIQLYK